MRNGQHSNFIRSAHNVVAFIKSFPFGHLDIVIQFISARNNRSLVAAAAAASNQDRFNLFNLLRKLNIIYYFEPFFNRRRRRLLEFHTVQPSCHFDFNYDNVHVEDDTEWTMQSLNIQWSPSDFFFCSVFEILCVFRRFRSVFLTVCRYGGAWNVYECVFSIFWFNCLTRELTTKRQQNIKILDMNNFSFRFENKKINFLSARVFFSLLNCSCGFSVFACVPQRIESIFILVKFTVWPANWRRSIGLLWSFINFRCRVEFILFLSPFNFSSALSVTLPISIVDTRLAAYAFHRARFYRFPSKMTFDFFSSAFLNSLHDPLCNSTVICRSVRLLKMRMAFIICVYGSVSRRWLYEVTVRLQPSLSLPLSVFAAHTITIRITCARWIEACSFSCSNNCHTRSVVLVLLRVNGESLVPDHEFSMKL